MVNADKVLRQVAPRLYDDGYRHYGLPNVAQSGHAVFNVMSVSRTDLRTREDATILQDTASANMGICHGVCNMLP